MKTKMVMKGREGMREGGEASEVGWYGKLDDVVDRLANRSPERQPDAQQHRALWGAHNTHSDNRSKRKRKGGGKGSKRSRWTCR